MIIKFIRKYIERLTINDIKIFCDKKDICYQDNELSFALDYIKNNYETILYNPDITLKEIKPHLSNQTYEQVKIIYFDYLEQYKNYL